VTKIEFAIWYSQGFRYAQTHSLTDGQTRMQYASGTVFIARRYAMLARY